MKITVRLRGCDDSTYIKDIEVTQDQLTLLESIAEMSVKISEYACMPTMEIDRENKGEPYY